MKSVRIVIGIVFVALLGWGTRLAPAEAGGYQITGPYVHGRLAVFLLHGTESDSRHYLTLDEGLRSGEVSVTELGEGEVNRLELENRSVLPLFLQEGDRLKGGKQDRIIGSSHVIPPTSGRVPVQSFCIEQRRWRSGETGASFTGNKNRSFATNAVRYAGKVEGSQSRVWAAVESAKTQAGLSRTSSLSELVDDPSIEARASCAVVALQTLLDCRDDVVGAAFAINGEVLEVGVYPSRELFAKIYPRLLLSYAIEATLATGEERAVAAGDVARVMTGRTSAPGEALQVRMPNGTTRSVGFAGTMDTGTHGSWNDVYTLRFHGNDAAEGGLDDFDTDLLRDVAGNGINRSLGGNGINRSLDGSRDMAGNGMNGTLSPATGPSLRSETTYKGALVHRQWLRRR